VVPAGLPRRVLWWGGLAGLALADVITWPVAAVVGAATYVAGREAAASRQDTVAAAAAAGAAAAAALTAGQGAAPATPDAGEQGRI
jgi:hypothetical protein